MADPARAHTFIESRFRAAGDATSAAAQKAYMKSELSFHGVTSEQVRAVARAFCEKGAAADHDTMVGVVDGLTRSEWFDVRSAGLAILERRIKLLEASDLDWLVDLVRRTRCWAHVDWIATKFVGAVLRKDDALLAKLPVWGADEDFWVQRTALLGQLEELRAGRGDFELFERIAAPLVEEREFFLRKAIGWVLREVSKKRPELSYRFLKSERDRVSGLTLREGAKYLPPEMRRALGLEDAGRVRAADDVRPTNAPAKKQSFGREEAPLGARRPKLGKQSKQKGKKS